MLLKEPAEVPCADAQPFGERLDVAIVERAVIDQPKCPLDRRPRALPCRREWRRFRSATETRAKACRLGRRRRRKEGHIGRPGGTNGTNRAAIDHRCPDTREEASIVARVPCDPGPFAC